MSKYYHILRKENGLLNFDTRSGCEMVVGTICSGSIRKTAIYEKMQLSRILSNKD